MTISERIFAPRVSSTTPPELLDRRLSSWKRIAADHDTEMFRTRLQLDGLRPEDAILVTDDVPRHVSASSVDWIDPFNWILTSLGREPSPAELHQVLDPAEKFPFEELFVSLILDASRAAGVPRPEVLDLPAILSLRRLLLAKLTSFCGKVFFEHFVLFRSGRTPEANSTQYASFIESMRSGELVFVFEQRPVLARIVSVTVLNWIDTLVELLARFLDDRVLIGSILPCEPKSLRIVDVAGGLSDPHNGGRTVFKLALSDGSKIGYKPKCLAVDVALRGFLQWAYANGAPPTFEVPKSINKHAYGWTEWIDAVQCASEDDARSFFFRAGSMLAVVACLKGTDFHAENVVAKGAIPVPVDLETLFQPWLPATAAAASGPSASAAAVTDLKNSVFSTYYLPSWTVASDLTPIKFGGLNPYFIEAEKETVFSFVNTDQMQVGTREIYSQQTPNLPMLNGIRLQAEPFVDEIKAGYDAMYRFLMSHRSVLLSHSVYPMAQFRDASVRVIVRPTLFYYY